MAILPYNGIWPTIADNVFIAPGAMVIGNVTLHEGVSVWFNAVIRGDSAPIIVGRGTNIQDNCTLHVDADAPLTIGEECTIGHQAIVHGATVDNRVLVGMNAVVLSHAYVESEVIIGASALVGERKRIPTNVLTVGIPAKVVRALTSDERASLVTSATHYQELGQEYIHAFSSLKKFDGIG